MRLYSKRIWEKKEENNGNENGLRLKQTEAIEKEMDKTREMANKKCSLSFATTTTSSKEWTEKMTKEMKFARSRPHSIILLCEHFSIFFCSFLFLPRNQSLATATYTLFSVHQRSIFAQENSSKNHLVLELLLIQRKNMFLAIFIK